MDHRRFDDLASRLAIGLSRRQGLGLLAALGLGVSVLADDAQAKKRKRRKKKKKVVLNGFGCVNVGSFCQNGTQCCSGICTGPKGKTTCQAHDQSTCTGQNTACSGGAGDPDCTTTAGVDGFCSVTTGNASFCVAALGSTCMTCAKDADCVATCGAGAACGICPQCAELGFQTVCLSTRTQGCDPF